MPIQTATQRRNAALGYTNAATHGALYSTAPGASQGTELTGGSPAYARKPLSWTGASDVLTAVATFDVASGSTVQGAGVHSSVTPNTAYLDGTTVTAQPFASQGTYTLTLTYQQT